MRNHWDWLAVSQLYENSSRPPISVWVTALSPRWPAPGTCHRGLRDNPSIKLRALGTKPPLYLFDQSIHVLKSHDASLNSLITFSTHDQLPHKEDIYIWIQCPTSLSQYACHKVTVTYGSAGRDYSWCTIYNVQIWLNKMKNNLF